ncbi:MAG: ATP-binding protein [Pseudomonadota bacterium]|nr:ATP-binding protein [Pseudomonadota bacterium]
MTHPHPAPLLRADLHQVPPTQLRAAHLALRLWFAHEAMDLSENTDFARPLWQLCLPLLNRDALNARVGKKLHALSQAEGVIPQRKPVGTSVERVRQGANAAAEANRLLSHKHTHLLRTDSLTALVVEELGYVREHLTAADWAMLAQADGDAPTHPSICLLSDQAGFGVVEQRLLDMAEKTISVTPFCSLLKSVRLPFSDALPLLAQTIECLPKAVAQALKRQAPLVSMNLLSGMQRHGDMEDYICPEDDLRLVLMAEPATSDELLAVFMEPASTGQWQLQDFPHLAADAQRTANALRQAAATAEKGVNALLYGPPGTGKTELAYGLAAAAGLRAFRVRTEDDDGDPMGRQSRLSAYVLLQRLLRHDRQCVLIFDEVEDVFSNGDAVLAALFGGHSAGKDKGWINRTLEENTVPAIWITNQTAGMDPAFLRRFMLPVAVGTPPLAVRRRMAQVHLPDGSVPPALREQLARDDKLQPAQFGMASRLLKLLPQADAADTVRQSLAASRRLIHGSGLPRLRQPPTVFDIEYLNVAGGIAPGRIVEALRRTGQGRLCFFGPPGTGKTEFAHVLAQALERELIVRTGAELMSKWVGETEQNIARLFDSADPQRSLILLDEVDSLLRSRALAEKSWETSQVNQLLQSMESYPGILIAATNLVDKLDAAALRRFDFKLAFKPLKPEQRLRLFAREVLGSADQASALPEAVAQRLLHMDTLTAGDFANVARQAQLLGESLGAEQYLRRLMTELRFKRAGQPDTALA